MADIAGLLWSLLTAIDDAVVRGSSTLITYDKVYAGPEERGGEGWTIT
jgi:hypothetical protein